MNDIYKEQISSLLDSELETSETEALLECIERDEVLARQFDRYALIRGALNNHASVPQASFLLNVQTALLDEPSLFEPAQKKPFNKGYLGVALAASVAIFTIFITDINVFSTEPVNAGLNVAIQKEPIEVFVPDERLDEELVETIRRPPARLATFER